MVLVVVLVEVVLAGDLELPVAVAALVEWVAEVAAVGIAGLQSWLLLASLQLSVLVQQE